MTGIRGEALERLRALELRAGTTTTLTTMIETLDPSPVFLDRDTDDLFARKVMQEQGALAADRHADRGPRALLRGARGHRGRTARAAAPDPGPPGPPGGRGAQSATALDNARLIETMAHQAATDNLTGLLGHRAFHEALAGPQRRRRSSSRWRRSTSTTSSGSTTRTATRWGDEALCQVARRCARACAAEDRVFRVGGEEFAVLMPGCPQDALPVAERLRAAVSATAFDPPLRISIGLASWPGTPRDRESLLRRADEALYAAKRGGKDRTVLYA